MSYLYTGPPLTPPPKKPSGLLGALPSRIPVGASTGRPRFPITSPIIDHAPIPAAQSTVDQVQTGMRRRRGSWPQQPAQPYQPSTTCTIDATGARVCTPSGGGAYPTSSTTGPWQNPQLSPYAPAPATTPAGTCVNVDPTSGVCLDSSILAAQQAAGLTTTAAATTTATPLDLSTVPAWVWYVLFAGVVYFLFFRKK